jgi:hypothetical protein
MIRRFIASLLVVCLAATSLPLHAGMLSTQAALGSGGERARIASLLEREEIRAQLEANGVRPTDVQARIAAMTDEEARELAGRIDQLPAGGDVLGVLLTVFIVLLITDILGFTRVFPFTRPVR